MGLDHKQPFIVKLQTVLFRPFRHIFLGLSDRFSLFHRKSVTHCLSVQIFLIWLIIQIGQILQNCTVYFVNSLNRGHKTVRPPFTMIWGVHALGGHSVSWRRNSMNDLFLGCWHELEVTLMRVDSLVEIMGLFRGEWEHVVLSLFHFGLKAFVLFAESIEMGLVEDHVYSLRRHQDHFLF